MLATMELLLMIICPSHSHVCDVKFWHFCFGTERCAKVPGLREVNM